MQHLQLKFLGPPDILVDGRTLDTDRHKVVALLAYLAADDRPHSRESLAALLWPDYPHQSAFAYLRRTLWELNRKLGRAWFNADRENVHLVRQPGLEVDLDQFDAHLRTLGEPVEALQQAVGLYRGDFLQGLVVADTAPFQEWQVHQSEIYRRSLAQALQKLVSRLEDRLNFQQALPYAQRWLALDRLDEQAWRAVIRQMAGMGDRSGALRCYQACARALKDELDVPPEPETEQLYQAILQGDLKPQQPLAASPLERFSYPTRAKGNLPVPSTPFVGRQAEIEQVIRLALLPGLQLLTLTGPGGTGKTRLSIQVAASLAAGSQDEFPDGVWYVPLSPVQAVPGIISAIAAGFNFPFHQGEVSRRQQLLDYLAEKRLLLVLDNFEHLLEGGQQLVGELLTAAPGVKLLVTSRQRLNLQAEQVYRVAGLRVPDETELAKSSQPEQQAKTYSAIQLLVECARRVKPAFEITPANLKPVLEICQLVDGSPLGIELAAAWLEVLPEEEIAQEILRSLDFLESTSVDTPERQRSLRMVFETSWKLLDSDEQRLFRRLCVFRGSFSRQAAQQVGGASPRSLLSLANKSWLQQTDSGRYQLHEVLKQYGLEHLKAEPGEWVETKEAQAEFYCRLLEEQGPALLTGQQVMALQALKPEMESNIPDAWEWLVSQGRIGALVDRVLIWIFHYWLIRGASMDYIPLMQAAARALPPGTDRTTQVLAAILEAAALNLELNLFVLDNRPKERLELLWKHVHAHRLAEEMGIWYVVMLTSYAAVINYSEGARRLREALQIIESQPDSWETGNCYLLAGLFGIESESISEGYLQRALQIFKKLGVIQEQGTTLRALGRIASSRMDYESAIEYTMQAQQYYEQVGDMLGIDSTWTNLAEYYLFHGKTEQAFHAFEELRHFSEKMGSRRTLGTDLSWESLHISRYGSLDLALELRQRSFAIAEEVGNQHDLAWAAWELGEVYRLMGHLEHARKYYAVAWPLFEQMQDYIGMGFYYRGLGDLAAMQADWRHAIREYEQAMAYHEREMRGNRQWGLALTNARLGAALVHLGQLDAAKPYLKTSLALAVEWKNPDLKSVPLCGIAAWLLASGVADQALLLAACVASLPTTWNEVKAQAREILVAARAALPAQDAARFQAQGEQMTVDEACHRFWGDAGF